MESAREDFIDVRRGELNRLKKRLDEQLSSIRADAGDEVARRDKALQDARDLVRLARQQLAELDSGSDEAYARDREGVLRTINELSATLDNAELRPS